MSFIGSFGMFTTVRLGIYTSQKGLNLTGNNIANINTEGYTRQVLNIKSMNASGVDRYSDSNVRIGSGAYVTGLSQLRDPYLDIRYRTECASVGYMDTKLSNLNDIAAILDEVGDGEDANGIISAQLADLSSALQNLTEYTGQGEFDTQVRSSAASLVALFNSYASKLEEVEVNAVDRFEKDLVTVNELLTNIRNLSTAIRTNDIHGSPSLESRDERNRLIDELSQYIKIEVEYTTENIGPAVDVEKLSIKLAGTYPGTYLLDGIYGVQLEQSDLNPNYDPTDPTSLPYWDKENNCPTAVSNFDLRMTALTDNKGNVKTTYSRLPTVEIVPGEKVFNENGDEVDIQEMIDALTAQGRSPYTWTTPAKDGHQTQYLLREIPGEDGAAPSYTLTQTEIKLSTGIELGDNDLYGALQAAREFLTESGEFATQDYIAAVDPNAATKRGVRYYKQALDLLARKFAETMNNANNDFRYTYSVEDDKYYYVDDSGTPITDPNGGGFLEKMQLLTDTELKQLEKKDPVAYREYMDKIAYLEANGSRAAKYGNLFSIRGDSNDAEGITAGNISISAAWASGDVQIVNSYSTIPGTDTIGTTDNTNILHLVHLMDQDMNYSPAELVGGSKDETMFTGSFSEMLGNINAVLGNDQSSTQIMLDNYYVAAVELDTSRDSVSSVDLNDETVNMIQYQKSYSAACRLMTTMDEILDKLINGTGIAGR